jgi:predicted negative regulator of RcsB-dependent stress response
VKGASAARQELTDRIKAGAQAFKYQLALAEFDVAQGNVADSVKLLEGLAKNAPSPEDAVAAQVRLAQIQFNQKKFDSAEALVSKILIPTAAIWMVCGSERRFACSRGNWTQQ